MEFNKSEQRVTGLNEIDELVRAYQPWLLRFVRSSIHDDDLAASVVQDTFLKAYMARDRFRGDCSVRTWLGSIAMNLVRDGQRTRKSQFWKHVNKTAKDVCDVASALPGRASSPEAQLLARERAAAVVGVVETLPENQKAVFLMHYFGEMNISDISNEMKMPVNTVKTNLHRAVRVVRLRVGNDCP